MLKDAPQLRWLLAAFGATVLCFMGATAYSQLRSQEIGILSESLWTNAMPSSEYLSAAGTELRHLQSLIDDYVAASGASREAELKAILESQRKIDEDVDAYLRLPVYPGEDRIFVEIRSALSEVNLAVARIRNFVELGDHTRAEASVASLDHACDRAVADVFTDVQFNAKNGVQIARRIGEIRRESAIIALALDAASVGLTVLVAWLAVRALRSHIALLRRHNQLLADRADELEIFAGRVAHDIRNPIGTASLSLVRLQRQVASDPKLAQSAARGLSSLERAARILDGLLAFARGGARPETGAISDVASVVPMLLDDLRPVATDARVELDYEAPPSCVVACDASILEVLISNLVRNAIKYMGDGPVRKITVRICDVGEAVRFEVEDTGMGIPPDQQRDIFAPFVRGATYGQPGVGLGLATVKRICDAHGGRVGVQSKARGGTCFWFELSKPPQPRPAALTHGKLELDH